VRIGGDWTGGRVDLIESVGTVKQVFARQGGSQWVQVSIGGVDQVFMARELEVVRDE
jgi:hypothetical protein